MLTIDLNADLGEWAGPGVSTIDAELLRLVTSANIACGAHAGSASVMRATVAEAARNGVAIGAHPGYADPEGFGRRELDLSLAEVAATVLDQVGKLQAICNAAGARLRYVKPHGALYNRAARDANVAETVVEATRSADRNLALLGLPGTALERAAERGGVRFAREAFVDRAYLADGTLVPRSEPDAVLHEVDRAVERAVRMVRDRSVADRDGTPIAIRADSLCVHGDGPSAVTMVRALRARLESEGVVVAAFAR